MKQLTALFDISNDEIYSLFDFLRTAVATFRAKVINSDEKLASQKLVNRRGFDFLVAFFPIDYFCELLHKLGRLCYIFLISFGFDIGVPGVWQGECAKRGQLMRRRQIVALGGVGNTSSKRTE